MWRKKDIYYEWCRLYISAVSYQNSVILYLFMLADFLHLLQQQLSSFDFIRVLRIEFLPFYLIQLLFFAPFFLYIKYAFPLTLVPPPMLLHSFYLVPAPLFPV